MKIDINNNISHQLLTLIITFLLGISIASNLYLNYHKNINTLDNKLENSLIKDKLIVDLLYLSQMENNISNNFKLKNGINLILNGGTSSTFIKHKFYKGNDAIYYKEFEIDKDNYLYEFQFKKFENKNLFSNEDLIELNNYLNDLLLSNNEYYHILEQKKQNFQDSNNLMFMTYIVIFIILSIGISIFIFRKIISNKEKLEKLNLELEYTNSHLEDKIEEKTIELRNLNDSLKEKIKEEVSKNREKDNYLIEQSRFIALGEMIGNIAHQWRQPLNSIGIIIQNITTAKILNQPLTLDELEEIELKINDQLLYMSNTIDSFRNFYKTNKEKETFLIKSLVEDVYTIYGTILKTNKINLVYDIQENYYLFGVKNELVQVLINLLSNSKDAFIERDIHERHISISMMEIRNNLIIKYNDNAGGIPEGIISKIFDPYFTTKHQSQGTGIGLYMSKTIVNKNYLGEIHVINSYDGIEFTITIPKKN